LSKQNKNKKQYKTNEVRKKYVVHVELEKERQEEKRKEKEKKERKKKNSKMD